MGICCKPAGASHALDGVWSDCGAEVASLILKIAIREISKNIFGNGIFVSIWGYEFLDCLGGANFSRNKLVEIAFSRD